MHQLLNTNYYSYIIYEKIHVKRDTSFLGVKGREDIITPGFSSLRFKIVALEYKFPALYLN